MSVPVPYEELDKFSDDQIRLLMSACGEILEKRDAENKKKAAEEALKLLADVGLEAEIIDPAKKKRRGRPPKKNSKT